jgi:hypothetical protein
MMKRVHWHLGDVQDGCGDSSFLPLIVCEELVLVFNTLVIDMWVF